MLVNRGANLSFRINTWAILCISYSYTRSVASKIFNYKASLQQLDFQGLSKDPPPCNCSDSQFLYAPCGHIVAGDLNIVRNIKLRDLLRKGQKYREPVSYSWHQNFGIIMDACEEYARRWVKKEDVEADTLSEWIRSIADVLKRRIRRLKHSVNTRHESIFQWPWCWKRTFPSPWEFCHSPRRQSIQQLYICLQETLRQHLDRGTLT